VLTNPKPNPKPDPPTRTLLSDTNTQALEVTEQLLSQSDLLLDPDLHQLPADCPASAFLSELAIQLRDRPPLGSVIRVPLPAVAVPLSVSPAKRAGAPADALLPLQW